MSDTTNTQGSNSGASPAFDARFLRLKALTDRLENFGEAMKLVTDNNVVVAGEALVTLALGKLAGDIVTNAAQSMGFHPATLANNLPEDAATIEKVVQQLARAAQSISKVVMKQFNISQQAAVAYLPITVDEMCDIVEDLLNRCDKHYAAALRANVASVPQADGDDGQLTDDPKLTGSAQ